MTWQEFIANSWLYYCSCSEASAEAFTTHFAYPSGSSRWTKRWQTTWPRQSLSPSWTERSSTSPTGLLAEGRVVRACQLPTSNCEIWSARFGIPSKAIQLSIFFLEQLDLAYFGHLLFGIVGLGKNGFKLPLAKKNYLKRGKRPFFLIDWNMLKTLQGHSGKNKAQKPHDNYSPTMKRT
jgi:hypothetical protein